MILISGSNNTNAQNYRAVIWWNLLNDFYLRQDPELSADMAIDKILLEMAYASEKPVLEMAVMNAAQAVEKAASLLFEA